MWKWKNRLSILTIAAFVVLWSPEADSQNTKKVEVRVFKVIFETVPYILNSPTLKKAYKEQLKKKGRPIKGDHILGHTRYKIETIRSYEPLPCYYVERITKKKGHTPASKHIKIFQASSRLRPGKLLKTMLFPEIKTKEQYLLRFTLYRGNLDRQRLCQDLKRVPKVKDTEYSVNGPVKPKRSWRFFGWWKRLKKAIFD